MEYWLQVSPLAKGAYFDDYLRVARSELSALVPGVEAEEEQIGTLDFLRAKLDDQQLQAVLRASFLQGVFAAKNGTLTPMDQRAQYTLGAEFVFGAKYQGKTNELATQLALNVAIAKAQRPKGVASLFDPMAGRGTTLLWGMRYGLDAQGIEIQPTALDDLHRHFKRQTKLQRQSHEHDRGSIGRKTRSGQGKFVRYKVAGKQLRMIAGDSLDAETLLAKQQFDVIVADLPYGVHFKGGPGGLHALIEARLPAWLQRLRPGGVMALLYNSYRPKRAQLEAMVDGSEFEILPFDAAHRMSESIVRELFVCRRRI